MSSKKNRCADPRPAPSSAGCAASVESAASRRTTTLRSPATTARISVQNVGSIRPPAANAAPRASPRRADSREDPLVLAEDDVPAVILSHVLAAVAAERRAEPFVADEKRQALDELVAIRVVEAAVAPRAVLDQHGAARV